MYWSAACAGAALIMPTTDAAEASRVAAMARPRWLVRPWKVVVMISPVGCRGSGVSAVWFSGPASRGCMCVGRLIGLGLLFPAAPIVLRAKPLGNRRKARIRRALGEHFLSARQGCDHARCAESRRSVTRRSSERNHHGRFQAGQLRPEEGWQVLPDHQG